MQSDKQHSFAEFKAALRSFEDTERSRNVASDDSVMKSEHKHVTANNTGRGNHRNIVCHRCKQVGHIARFCESKPNMWCSFCQKNNHIDSTCRSKSKANKDSKDKVHVANTTDEEQFAFKVNTLIGDVSSVRSSSLLVDCGATAHIITDKF